MSTLYSPKIPTDGLLSHLDAENIKSCVSGSSFWRNMAATGTDDGYVATFAGSTQTFFDAYPKAVRIFQGASNSNNIFTQSLSFNENFTLLLWYKPQATSSGIANQSESPGIIQIGAYAQNASLTVWDWCVNTPNSHQVKTYLDNGAVWSDVQASATYPDAAWCNKYHHIALAFSGSLGKWNSYRLYIDGTLQTTMNFAIPFPSASIAQGNKIYAPAASGGSANNSYAMISTYSRYFLQSDIVAHYNATKGRFGK